jgi:hypothetical protein
MSQVLTQAKIFRNIIKLLWNTTDVRRGIIATSEERPLGSISYGIWIEELNTNFAPGGFDAKQTSAEGGDSFFLTVIGSTVQIRNQISQLIKVADTFNRAGGDDDYDQIYPDADTIRYDRPDDRSVQHWYRQATISVLASINNKNIFT